MKVKDLVEALRQHPADAEVVMPDELPIVEVSFEHGKVWLSDGERNLAVLTPEENHAWEFAHCFYLNEGLSAADADIRAWDDLTREFPRLAEFDGAEP